MDDDCLAPGTVHLVDSEGIVNSKHAPGTQDDIVLVPTPSSDPNDPLNWSKKRKLLSTACVSVYTLVVSIAATAIYSLLEPITKDTHLTLGDLNTGNGYMLLLFGWGCLFWQPIALQYGKRPVYLFSLLATAGVLIWGPYINTNGQWIAAKLLQGFFGAPLESLCEISITDIHFTHNRGSYIALYGFFLAGGSFVAPIPAGFINDSLGWKWVLYLCAILCAIAFVVLFFCMEETNFHRDVSFETHKVDSEGLPSAIKQPDDVESAKESDPKMEMNNTTSPDSDRGYPEDYRKMSYWNKLKIFDKKALQYPNHLKGMVLRPLIFLSFPVVFYSGFMYGSSLIWFTVLNGTASLILSGEPYNFSSSIVGLCYFSPLIGVSLGSLYSGRIGDWLILKLARRKGGIMEPESRLWLFLLSIILIPGGLILWGVGAAQNIHWFGLVFAMGVIAITNSLGLNISVSYCIDCYRELSGETIVTVILIRNTMSFAIGYSITPWVTNMGPQNAFIVAAFAGLAQVLSFLLMIQYGRARRQASSTRYRLYVHEMKAAGLIH